MGNDDGDATPREVKSPRTKKRDARRASKKLAAECARRRPDNPPHAAAVVTRTTPTNVRLGFVVVPGSAYLPQLDDWEGRMRWKRLEERLEQIKKNRSEVAASMQSVTARQNRLPRLTTHAMARVKFCSMVDQENEKYFERLAGAKSIVKSARQFAQDTAERQRLMGMISRHRTHRSAHQHNKDEESRDAWNNDTHHVVSPPALMNLGFERPMFPPEIEKRLKEQRGHEDDDKEGPTANPAQEKLPPLRPPLPDVPHAPIRCHAPVPSITHTPFALAMKRVPHVARRHHNSKKEEEQPAHEVEEHQQEEPSVPTAVR